MVTKKDIASMGFTQVNQVGYSQAFTAIKNNSKCFLSYMTIIGIYDQVNKQAIFTDKYYSVTTSRHRNKFIREHCGVIDNDRFHTLLIKYGLTWSVPNRINI